MRLAESYQTRTKTGSSARLSHSLRASFSTWTKARLSDRLDMTEICSSSQLQNLRGGVDDKHNKRSLNTLGQSISVSKFQGIPPNTSSRWGSSNQHFFRDSNTWITSRANNRRHADSRTASASTGQVSTRSQGVLRPCVRI